MPSPTSLDHRASPPHSSHRANHRSPNSRSRSRSPPPRRRTNDKPKISSGAFRWKDKSRDTEQYGQPDERRLERGYRERDREDRYRDRGRDDRDDRDGYRNGDSRRRERDADRRDHRSYDSSKRDGRGYDSRERYDDRAGRRNEDERPTERRRRESRSPPTSSKPTQEAKSKKPKAPKIAPTEQPMIIVNVNDRLGDFKKLVGAHIGRKPHEIMLKRQGERPFKDILSLEDYGVSHGVQLDLEVDTGD
ncbi:MAG: hypothetical protein Q9180_002321 [Flavoplaca navasiana]